MTRRILILDGHPDPSSERFLHALASAYKQGAEEAKHEVLLIRLADLDFPLLRAQEDYERGEPVEAVKRCQATMEWATQVVIPYPLWLGGMPALLKGLLEQIFRPGFAFSRRSPASWPVKLLGGKRARIIVAMGMPALIYRWYYGAHSLRSLRRNILRFVGFRNIRVTMIGTVATMSDAKRSAWLAKMRALGRKAR
jgi:putative NADPH-quinone reductase